MRLIHNDFDCNLGSLTKLKNKFSGLDNLRADEATFQL